MVSFESTDTVDKVYKISPKTQKTTKTDKTPILTSFSYDFSFLPNAVDKNSKNMDPFIYNSSISHDDEPKPAEKENSKPQRRLASNLPIPHTAPWILRRLQNDTLEESLTTLRLWMPTTRHNEANAELISLIRQFETDHALAAIQSLKEPRRVIRRANG